MIESDDMRGPINFGNELLDLLDQRGWHTIPRRELTLWLLHLASKAGVLDLFLPRWH